MTYATAGAMLLIWFNPAVACGIEIKLPAPLSIERVSGFSIHVHHAAIAGMSYLRTGWQITIDNDPSWNSSLSGHAIVGAAFIQGSELNGLIAISPEHLYTCAGLAKSDVTTFSVTIYKNDRLQTLKLSPNAVRVVDNK